MNDLIETAWLNWLNGAYCARAALAEPEPVGPTDEELVKHYARSVTSAIDSRVAMHLLTDEDLDAATAAGLRAVLARWGNPATPPAPEVGEVGELSPKEVEAQDAFMQMRDEVLSLSDGVEVNEVLGIIDNHTPEWV